MSTKRIVHLDVTPRNVIMSAPPRLVDLSVATSLDELAAITGPIGTDAYMAPEQCDAARFHEIGPHSDIWGLGITLYEALARSLPFPPSASDSRVPERRYPQIAADPRPLPKQVPDTVATTILSCLEREPANRPSARELAEALEPWVAALPPPRLGRFRPGGRARRSDFELG
jgi:serine/threonine protein kinase